MDPITTRVSVHDDNLTVLSVGGAVDLATAPVLEDALETALSQVTSTFIVDLTDVDFLASVGMAILVSVQQRTSPTTAFAVVADGPATGRPLKLTGLDQVLTIYPTLPDALASCASS
jgi:anti-anti-sigma factor